MFSIILTNKTSAQVGRTSWELGEVTGLHTNKNDKHGGYVVENRLDSRH